MYLDWEGPLELVIVAYAVIVLTAHLHNDIKKV